jgi:hypothetical protein
MTYSLFNKTEQREAIARNVSRSGIYFETSRLLSPGLVIVIRNKGAMISEGTEQTRYFIHPTDANSETCKELKTQVVGEVKRCEKLEEGPKRQYGVAVQYVSPSV